MLNNVDGSAVRLVGDTDAGLAAIRGELVVRLIDITAACRERLMAVAVDAGLASAMVIIADETVGLCGDWNAADPQRTHVRGGPKARVSGDQVRRSPSGKADYGWTKEMAAHDPG